MSIENYLNQAIAYLVVRYAESQGDTLRERVKPLAYRALRVILKPITDFSPTE